MKIYPNNFCPCGSGKKYKKCCMKKDSEQFDMIGFLPVDSIDGDADFFVNRKGAVVFNDESKQPVLEIPEGFSITKTVLSVGFIGTHKPVATIREGKGAICYILPDWYIDWCQSCVGMAINGINIFPADVKFSREGNVFSVAVL